MVLRISFLLFLTTFCLIGPRYIAAQPVTIRVSSENAEDHVQTRGIQAFAREVERRSDGRITVEVYHSGSLFRDVDVFQALRNGQVEMAVPGTWNISRFEPAVSAFLLPYFFGRSADFIHHHSDGELGRLITERLETALGVVVPGRWFDLGHGHLFFLGRAVTGHDQLDGLTIRVAGGLGNELRVEALGARPISIPWTDLPQRLLNGRIDGVLTAYETVRSGELWRYGVSNALEDSQYFPQYIPLIRRSFWMTLRPEDREIIREAWDAVVDGQRRNARRAATESRRILVSRGIGIYVVGEVELNRVRTELMSHQERFAREMGVPEGILDVMGAAAEQ